MATAYAQTPDNYSEIEKSVVSDVDKIKSMFFEAEKVVFYEI